MYGKLFESTFTGSMYGAGPVVFAVWGYIIAHTKSDSRVELNPAALANTLGVKDVKDVRDAIAKLASPDPASRSKTAEGRRIVKEAEYQYMVVNHGYYRAIKSDSERKEYNRLKKKESRDRAKAQALNNDVSNGLVNDLSTQSANVSTSASASASVSGSEKEGGAGGNRSPEPPWDPLTDAEMRGEAQAVPVLSSAQPFPMTPDWDPGVVVLSGAGIPDWAHTALIAGFRVFHLNKRTRRTETDWLTSYGRWATQNWQDPAKRPKPPPGAEPLDPEIVARKARAARNAARIAADFEREIAQKNLEAAENARQRAANGIPEPSFAALVANLGKASS